MLQSDLICQRVGRMASMGSLWGVTVWSCLLAFSAGCDDQRSGAQSPAFASTTTARAREEEYERQLAESQRNLKETSRQLQESDQNLRESSALNRRFAGVLERWESQSARVDELLDRWKKIADNVESRIGANSAAPSP